MEENTPIQTAPPMQTQTPQPQVANPTPAPAMQPAEQTVMTQPAPKGSSKTPLFIILILIIIAVIAGVLYFMFGNKTQTQSTQNVVIPTATEAPSPTQTIDQKINSDTQSFNASLDALSSSSASIDSSLNDKQTDLTP